MAGKSKTAGQARRGRTSSTWLVLAAMALIGYVVLDMVTTPAKIMLSCARSSATAGECRLLHITPFKTVDQTIALSDIVEVVVRRGPVFTQGYDFLIETKGGPVAVQSNLAAQEALEAGLRVKDWSQGAGQPTVEYVNQRPFYRYLMDGLIAALGLVVLWRAILTEQAERAERGMLARKH